MRKRILTVDDSKTMRDMVSFTLKSAGFDVVEAEDGAKALALLASTAVPDIAQRDGIVSGVGDNQRRPRDIRHHASPYPRPGNRAQARFQHLISLCLLHFLLDFLLCHHEVPAPRTAGLEHVDRRYYRGQERTYECGT